MAIKRSDKEIKMDNWTKAAALRLESSELLRKAMWQGQSLAIEGNNSAAIDKATKSKMDRIAAISIEVSSLMAAV